MRTTLMTTKAKDLVSAPTRRERQRAATHDEIVTVARQLLGSPDALSLRAIAAEMGLTAPALYRYVDSYHELLMPGGGDQFSEFFTDIFLRLWDRYRFTVSPGGQLIQCAPHRRRRRQAAAPRLRGLVEIVP